MIWYRKLCGSNKGECSFFNLSKYFLKIWVWNLGENANNSGNQSGNTGNQGRYLGIAVELTYKKKQWK